MILIEVSLNETIDDFFNKLRYKFQNHNLLKDVEINCV